MDQQQVIAVIGIVDANIVVLYGGHRRVFLRIPRSADRGGILHDGRLRPVRIPWLRGNPARPGRPPHEGSGPHRTTRGRGGTPVGPCEIHPEDDDSSHELTTPARGHDQAAGGFSSYHPGPGEASRADDSRHTPLPGSHRLRDWRRVDNIVASDQRMGRFAGGRAIRTGASSAPATGCGPRGSRCPRPRRPTTGLPRSAAHRRSRTRRTTRSVRQHDADSRARNLSYRPTPLPRAKDSQTLRLLGHFFAPAGDPRSRLANKYQRWYLF